MGVPVSFRFPVGLVERIDVARGLVPRTRWVVAVLEEVLGDVGEVSSASSRVPGRAAARARQAELSRHPKAGVVPRPKGGK